MANRFLLDSNIHDKLIDEPEALDLLLARVESGSVVILSTHVQRDQLAQTPDRERAERLAAVPVEQVPTSGFVAGVSRAGMARVAEAETIESLRRGNLDHTPDALIAATAEYEGGTLVTEDRTLTSRARSQGIPVMGWNAFRELLLSLDG